MHELDRRAADVDADAFSASYSRQLGRATFLVNGAHDLVAGLSGRGVGVAFEVDDREQAERAAAARAEFIVASADATNTAEALGIAVDDAVTEIDGGDLLRDSNR